MAMMLHARRFATLLLAGALAAGCTSARKAVVATEFDAHAPVRVSPGQSFVITLPADRDAGYAWHLMPSTLDALALDGDPTYMAESGSGAAAGAPGSESWRFVALRRGRDELRFEYRGTAGPDTLRVLRYEVLVR